MSRCCGSTFELTAITVREVNKLGGSRGERVAVVRDVDEEAAIAMLIPGAAPTQSM